MDTLDTLYTFKRVEVRPPCSGDPLWCCSRGCRMCVHDVWSRSVCRSENALRVKPCELCFSVRIYLVSGHLHACTIDRPSAGRLLLLPLLPLLQTPLLPLLLFAGAHTVMFPNRAGFWETGCLHRKTSRPPFKKCYSCSLTESLCLSLVCALPHQPRFVSTSLTAMSPSAKYNAPECTVVKAANLQHVVARLHCILVMLSPLHPDKRWQHH